MQNLLFKKYEKDHHQVLEIFGIKFKYKLCPKNIINQMEWEKSNLQEQILRITPQSHIHMFEIHIVEHCNLNCQACSHFSTLAEEEFENLESYTNDVKKLSEITKGRIDIIHILGGEPLLHPQCVEFLKVARYYFPKSMIRLITNGILLPKQDDNFYKTLGEYNIIIEPTHYPIKIDWEFVKEKCSKYNVTLEFYNNFEKVKTSCKWPINLDGNGNPNRNFLECFMANFCILMYKGKITTCSLPLMARHFNKYFNKNLEITELDYIDIHKVQNYNELLSFLAKPIPFCRYCDVRCREWGHPWKVSSKKIEEWINVK